MPSADDGRAELALEQSQAVTSFYFQDHGRLPDQRTMNAETHRFLKREGIWVDPSWTFSYSSHPGSQTPTVFVLLKVEGPKIRPQTYGYDLSEESFEAGKKVAARNSRGK